MTPDKEELESINDELMVILSVREGWNHRYWHYLLCNEIIYAQEINSHWHRFGGQPGWNGNGNCAWCDR